jgi:hypothetical protein
MEDTNMLIIGPINIADIAVPQGCEQVPAVGTGIGMQEMIKTTAPIKPRSGLKVGRVLALFFTFKIPIVMNGSAIKYQKPAHFPGKIPSEICIRNHLLSKLES